MQYNKHTQTTVEHIGHIITHERMWIRMPNMEEKSLPVWVTECRTVQVQRELVMSTDRHENCIMRLMGGKCKAFYKDKTYSLNERSLLMLGRNTSTRLEFESQTPGEILLLRYAHTYTAPLVDLNHLCTAISLLDSFYGRKGRFCILTDHNHIYQTLGELQREWNGEDPEKESMIAALLHVLLISMARSFQENNQRTGIQYLSRARTYIQQHYNEMVTLDEIAQAAGVSRSYLTQLFRHHMNKSVVDYIQAVRCDHAAFLLGTTRFRVIDIALETGFTNRQHFARTFSRLYGLSPIEYRQEHEVRTDRKDFRQASRAVE